MSDLNIRDLYLAPPEAGIKECTVSGWVRTVRDSKAFGFIDLNQLPQQEECGAVGNTGGLLHVVGDNDNGVLLFQV